MTLPLAPVGAIARLSTIALFVLVVEATRVEVPRALPDGEQVAGSFTLVNSKLARCILNALPLLQKPTRCFSLSAAALVLRSPGNPLMRVQCMQKGKLLSGPALSRLPVLFHWRQIQMTTKSLEIRTTSMTPEPKIDT